MQKYLSNLRIRLQHILFTMLWQLFSCSMKKMRQKNRSIKLTKIRKWRIKYKMIKIQSKVQEREFTFRRWINIYLKFEWEEFACEIDEGQCEAYRSCFHNKYFNSAIRTKPQNKSIIRYSTIASNIVCPENWTVDFSVIFVWINLRKKNRVHFVSIEYKGTHVCFIRMSNGYWMKLEARNWVVDDVSHWGNYGCGEHAQYFVENSGEKKTLKLSAECDFANSGQYNDHTYWVTCALLWFSSRFSYK